jgi:hypothetical protein
MLTKICGRIEGGSKKKYGALGTVFSQTVLGAKQGWRYIRGVTVTITALFEKLAVSQLVKKILRHLWKTKSPFRVYRFPQNQNRGTV